MITKSILVINKFSILFVLLLYVFGFMGSVYFPSSSVSAQEGCTEERLLDLGVTVINCTGDSVCNVPKTAATTNKILASGSSIYMLGDSITFLSQAELENEFVVNGYSVSKINADSGRAISTDTAGSEPTGLEAVAADSQIISGSDAVIIALGTNSGNEDLEVQVPAQIKAVRDTGFTGPIYWINLFYTKGGGPEIRNAVITSLSTTENYTVIDMTSTPIALDAEGLHPVGEGKTVFAQTINTGLKTIPSTGGLVPPTTTGNCVCGGSSSTSPINSTITWGEGVWTSGSEKYQSGLTGPYTIEQWAIHVLKNISRKSGVPESELVTQAKVVSLIAWAKAEGGGVNGNNGTFNPLNTKSQYSDIESGNQGNAATDTNSQGYTTFDDGVEAITRGIFNIYQKRVGSALLRSDLSALDFIEAIAGDFVAEPYGTSDQSKVINRQEDIYPGDKAYAALSITGLDYGSGIGDRAKYVEIKQSTLKSVQENYEQYAGKILDGSPPGTPEPLVFSSGASGGGEYTGGSCQQASGGVVNTEGYSFPLEPQTRAVGGISVGQTVADHHDGTDAYDLYSSIEGAAVYSIFKGTPTRINQNFNGVAGCSSIQFKAADGFNYWYGHLRNVVVQEGVEIEAGVKMAEVADASFGSECVGGGPHLHIDKGCSINGVPQDAGNDSCRDPEFIPFLSALYESLPTN